MRITINSVSEERLGVIFEKLKSQHVHIIKMSRNQGIIVADLRQHQSEILFDILELDGILTRDSKNDLD